MPAEYSCCEKGESTRTDAFQYGNASTLQLLMQPLHQ